MARLGLALGTAEERGAADILRLAEMADDRGYEVALVSEAWGREAFAVLGWLAAHTRSIRLGTGIVNVYSRSPALIAMAAATLDELSSGRALLGLGVSGRAVVEGWHGVEMSRPLRRLREVTEAVRGAVRRSRRGFAGETARIAPGFALSFRPPREEIPIYHACLTPSAIRQCAEIADGWLPYLLTPQALAADLRVVEETLRRAGRDRAAFTVAPLIPALTSDDVDGARALLKQHIAFYVGGMGRFYHEVLARHGFADAVDRVRAEWVARRRDAAAEAVPDDLVDAVALAGPPERCRERLAAYRASGADLPIVYLPVGATLAQAERTLRALAEDGA